MLRLKLVVVIAGLSFTGWLAAGEPNSSMPASPSADGASLYFISPQNGEIVATTFTVRFGLAGMGVAPAGIDVANTGHHHLLVDHAGQPAVDQPLPATDQLRHFGGGQTEAELTLAPGTHRLQLILGNYLHTPHDPPVTSKEITITVSE
ncbi:MAG: DUF4399 domain-containing protein [Gammaproteobacteria bacterium]|nr:DUF4399 domain-containing protein [Gammaproteobacteria bacterium]